MQATSIPEMAGEPLPQEFEDLFEAHYLLVYRTAYGVTGRVEDAEDAVQTVFLRLLQRDRPPDFLKNPQGYLSRRGESVVDHRATPAAPCRYRGE